MKLIRLCECAAILLVVVAFIMGLYGFIEFHKQDGVRAEEPGERFVWTTALFLGELDLPEGAADERKITHPWQVHRARVLAVVAITLVIIILSIRFIYSYLRESYLGGFFGRWSPRHLPILNGLFGVPFPPGSDLAKDPGSVYMSHRWLYWVSILRCRPEKVIINLPDELVSLIPEKRFWGKWRRPVVFCTSDKDGGLVTEAARRAGHLVIQADPREPDFIQRFGIRKAQEVFIFGPDAPSNLSLGRECFKAMCGEQAVPFSQNRIRHVYFQCEDPDVRQAFQTELLGGDLALPLKEMQRRQFCERWSVCWPAKLGEQSKKSYEWMRKKLLASSVCPPIWPKSLVDWLQPCPNHDVLVEKMFEERYYNRHALLLDSFSLTVATAREQVRAGRLTLRPDLAPKTTTTATAQSHSGQRLMHGGTTYLLCGRGRLLRAFFEETLKHSVVCREEKPVIHVLTDETDLERKLRAVLPAWHLLHARKICFHVVDQQPELVARKAVSIIRRIGSGDAPWNMIALLEDDGDNLACASMVRSRLMALCPQQGHPASGSHSNNRLEAWKNRMQRGRILFHIRNSKNFAHVFRKLDGAPQVIPVAPYDQHASLDMISQRKTLALALAVNGEYVKSRTHLARDMGSLVSKFSLNATVKRAQNFAQADHVPVKLDFMGLCPMDSISRETVEKKVTSLREDFIANLKQVSQAPEISSLTSKSEKKDMVRALKVIGSRLFSDPIMSQDELMRLADLEHLRWLQVHVLAGFRFANAETVAAVKVTSKDDLSHRLHTCLAQFQDPDFAEQIGTIVYDIDSVLLLPSLVGLMQLQRERGNRALF